MDKTGRTFWDYMSERSMFDFIIAAMIVCAVVPIIARPFLTGCN